MQIVIKEAKIEDLELVQKLNKDLFKHHQKSFNDTLIIDWPFKKVWANYYEKQLSQKNTVVFIAYYKEDAIWYLNWSIKKWRSYNTWWDYAELEDMFIKGDRRWFWVWSKLIEKFYTWVRMKNIKRVIVHAYSSNNWAIKFYESNWFREETTILEKFL